jgi:hypothetical protein
VTWGRRDFIVVTGTVAAATFAGCALPEGEAPADLEATDPGAAQAAPAPLALATADLSAARHARHRREALDGSWIDATDPFHSCELDCTASLRAYDLRRPTWR